MSTAKKVTPAPAGHVWVGVKKAAELLGLTPQAIYARVKRRQWRAGIEWKKCEGTLFINMPGVYAWIEQA